MGKQIDGQISLFDYMTEAAAPVRLFAQCAVCWCSDCRHNEKLDAVPRDFAGVEKACPSCALCLRRNRAEVCEIGSYDNGCKLRALEEGMAP